MIKAVSSAKSQTRNDEACTMSLIYIKNKVGPRIEPCGTPHLISFNEDFTLLVNTYCTAGHVILKWIRVN